MVKLGHYLSVRCNFGRVLRRSVDQMKARVYEFDSDLKVSLVNLHSLVKVGMCRLLGLEG